METELGGSDDGNAGASTEVSSTSQQGFRHFLMSRAAGGHLSETLASWSKERTMSCSLASLKTLPLLLLKLVSCQRVGQVLGLVGLDTDGSAIGASTKCSPHRAPSARGHESKCHHCLHCGIVAKKGASLSCPCFSSCCAERGLSLSSPHFVHQIALPSCNGRGSWVRRKLMGKGPGKEGRSAGLKSQFVMW
jgi:hypothetical protein